MHDANATKRHILSSHPSCLPTFVNMSTCQRVGLYICSHPNCASRPRDSIFTSQSAFARHQAQLHPSPPSTPSTSTLSIVLDTIATNLNRPDLSSTWSSAFTFISQHHQVTPPNFRHSWHHFLKGRNATAFTQLQAGLLRSIYLAHASESAECNPTPFWWLFLHLELLILHPTASSNRDGGSIQETIAERIASFRSGHIEELWDSAHSIVSRPTSTTPATPASHNRAIQHAADNDNWRTANKRATSTQTKATISPANEAIIEGLYSAPLPPIHPPSPPSQPPDYSLPGDICATIKSLPGGKANGIIADSIDAFRRLVRLNNEVVNADLYFFFNAIFTAKIPSEIAPYLRDTYLFCLHKDPDDPSKLRPIGVPTAVRRIIGNHIARTFKSRLAHILLPLNYAVGVPNGQDFAIKTTQLAIEKFITAPQSKGELPTRAVVFTDMKNMFNLISREELRDCLRSHLPELTPIADLLYQQPGTVHYQHGSGDWFQLAMEEGVNQGCPLSSIFAALVFNRVLEPLQASLNQRAANRVLNGDLGDDGLGSVTIITAFVDDSTKVVPLVDIDFFFRELNRLAPNRGCQLNRFKTRILTSTNGTSPIPAIRFTNPSLADELQAAINTYSVTAGPSPTDPPIGVELLEGCRLLGAPVGSPKFAQQFFNERILAAIIDANKLTETVPDLQTRLRLFAQCTIHKIPHLLGYDVLHHLPLDYNLGDVGWQAWQGHLIDATNSLISTFFKNLLNLDSSLPSHSTFIAQGSLSLGGLGIPRPSARAIPDFVLTMAMATRSATYGFRLHKEAPNFHLPQAITSLYHLASNPTSHTLLRFQHALPTIALIAVSHHVPADQRINHLLTRTSLNSARGRLRMHSSHTTVELIYNETPSDLRHLLPGVLSPHMSYPLIHMCRSNPSHRLSNPDFIISLKRKLLLPLYSPQSAPTCKCGKTHDIHGLHHFRCQRNSKTFVHNYIATHGLQTPLQSILSTAGIIQPSSTVSTEVTGHIPNQTGLRPFDIEWQPQHGLGNSNLTPSPFAIVGADVTITHDPDPLLPTVRPDITNFTANAVRCHQDAERRKFTTMSNSTVTPNLVSREEVLATLHSDHKLLQMWSICPHGGMGPMLRKFLLNDNPHTALTFTDRRPHATTMYRQSNQSYSPHGILPLADSSWKSNKLRKFYGHSYTAPTPTIHFLQQFGLACTKAFANHLRRRPHKQRSITSTPSSSRAPPGLSSPFSSDTRI